MKLKKEALLLYAVTDRSWVGRLRFCEQVEAALSGGVTMLQLREKALDRGQLLAAAIEVKALCHRYGVPFLVNDNVEIALECGADGVHVGLEDMPVAEIRRRTGQGFLIGATAKTVAQAQSAQAAGADYLGVGAVFPSPTKQNALRITPEQLHEICGSVSIPAVAIGGISLENIDRLQGSGASGIAVVSALFGAADIAAAAGALRKKAAAALAESRMIPEPDKSLI